MIARADLEKTARAHLRDAKILQRRGSYDGTVYLYGYAVEIALKARICRTLKWSGFPSTASEFQNFKSLQTHNLEALLQLSGIEARVKTTVLADWIIGSSWRPEVRYNPVGTMTQADATDMVTATERILKVLL